MKVKFHHKESNLPGSFSIEAETEEEVFILRVFGNWPFMTKNCYPVISPCGGNSGEGRAFINISWTDKRDDLTEERNVRK